MNFVATQQKKYNFFAFAAPKFGSYGKYSYLCTQKIVLVNRKATLTVVLLCRLSGAVFYLCFFGTSSAQLHIVPPAYKKTIPGSLISQGLSGLNDAKIRIFLQTSKYFSKNLML